MSLVTDQLYIMHLIIDILGTFKHTLLKYPRKNIQGEKIKLPKASSL